MGARVEDRETTRETLDTPRGWLVEALLQLLRSRPYQGLTVAEIAERAGVSRRTFYRLFPTRAALLAAALDDLCAAFARRLLGSSEFSFPTLARAFLGLWFEELATVRALDRDRLLYLLFDAMNASIPKVPGLAEDWGRVYGRVEMGLDVLAFSLGGFWDLLHRWLREDAGRSPDELARRFAREMTVVAAWGGTAGQPVERCFRPAKGARVEAAADEAIAGTSAVDRSRIRILEAFSFLLRGKPYGELTVDQIARRAGLSRRTLYRVFHSREALLAGVLEDLCMRFERRLLGAGGHSLPSVVGAFLGFWFDDLSTMRGLDRSGFLPRLREEIGAFILGIRELTEDWGQHHGCAEEMRDALTFALGGCWNLLVLWMRGRRKRGPEDVRRLLDRGVAVWADPAGACRWEE
jgi:AcrR family transcriptional regulator